MDLSMCFHPFKIKRAEADSLLAESFGSLGTLFELFDLFICIFTIWETNVIVLYL